MTAQPPDPRPPRTRSSHGFAMWRVLAVAATAVVSAIALMLGGCASSAGIGPVAHALAPAQIGLVGDPDETATAPVADDWWRNLGDPAVTALIERALAEQPGLKIARARLASAQAAAAGAQASAGVHVDGALDVTRERFSANGMVPPPLGGSTQSVASAQIGASWEIDFFGRNRAAVDAAIGSERAARADVQAARLLLASRVARAAVQLGTLQAQRAVAAGALKQDEDTLALIRDRVRAGLDSNVELRQGESALPEARRRTEQIDEQIMLTRHALAALTAQPPHATDELRVALDKLHLAALPQSLPADLLGRRADITAARWRAEAARADMQGAKAQFYPNVDLTAFVGLSSIGLEHFFEAGSRQIGVGPAIRLPIFDSGRLRANLRAEAAAVDAAVESYNNALIDAVHDVADQLGALRSIARQQHEQALARTAAESAYDLALQRYRAGLGTYLIVLSAETSVLNQRRLAVDLQGRALATQIALIHALGGGYRADVDRPLALRTEQQP